MSRGEESYNRGRRGKMIKLIHGDCRKFKVMQEKVIVVTDPPFNVGYGYNSYKDKMDEEEYLEMLAGFATGEAVIIHYPEMLHKLSMKLGKAPTRIVSWVYNSNTGRQHRDIAFYGVTPDFRKVRQPYKNPNDKRIKERIAQGKLGGRLYDWWNVNQIKNDTKNKDNINHPCVMPVEVMKNIIGILPEDYTILDPFMGSGTTGVACKELRRDFIGIEIDDEYFKLCERRLGVDKGE